ncbi:MAG: glucoamylase family protein [Pyrinomonadaceae bacterium]
MKIFNNTLNPNAAFGKLLPRLLAIVLLLHCLAQYDFAQARRSEVSSGNRIQAARLEQSDDAFLEDLSRRSFQYFWEHSDPNIGLTSDRARTDGTAHPPTHNSHNIASSAATGFALSGLCIAADRKWITQRQARERTRKTLQFFANQAEHKNGWFYHWMDKATGERRWRSEISSIDTALLMGGVLTVRQCFRDDKEIYRLATRIYDRIDFGWMRNGHPYLLSHGWRPENGFITHRWDNYSEHASLYILAIASRTHPVSPLAWYAWRRHWVEFAGYRYIASASPLFIHQYPQAWLDLRGWRERRPPFVDYYDNSVKATRAHRAFFLSLGSEFPTYSANIWGMTASDSVKGYVAWGAPPRHPDTDGTVVPCAAGGSLMFTPDIALPALREMQQLYGNTIYGRYGFTDAFNPGTGWVGPDVIGIDVGITLLSAENLRSGNVWRWFMRNMEVRRALRLVGLRSFRNQATVRGRSRQASRTSPY